MESYVRGWLRESGVKGRFSRVLRGPGYHGPSVSMEV